MADNRLVTENFLRLNFTPMSGITPGTNDTLNMDCDQIKARYNVGIAGVSSIGVRLPSQNQVSANIINNPDFIVLRYTWASTDGTDLDTLTEFTASGISGLNGAPVGWMFNTPIITTQNTLDILKWAGDNQLSGNESVLIDLTVLTNATNNPNLVETSLIDIYGNWYASKGSGNCSIELIAYRGGTMSKSGFVYVNTGGTVVSTKNIAKIVTAVDPANHTPRNCSSFRTSYTYLGQMTYTKSSGNITLSL